MFFGLLSRRERWGLSLRGWLVLTALTTAASVGVALTIHPFLAVTERSAAEYLAVEGWIRDHAIRAARDEFHAGQYRDVFSTGGPVSGIGGYINDYSTAANIGAHRLKQAGVPAQHVHAVPSRVSARDRTYHSATALREWLHRNSVPVREINIVTEDVHARRTRLLFQKAFGPGVTVGVIGIPNPDYNPKRWWRYSEGVRDVLGETIAYLYALLFFHPSADDMTHSLRHPESQ